MKRPWNLANIPVYSLATGDGGRVNMNICTYVSVVSMDPKRYMVAVYLNTQSLHNLQQSNTAVLQLLGKKHIALVNVLGKKSGKTYNKEQYLIKRQQVEIWDDSLVLSGCAAWVKLKKRWSKEAGDHTIFVFDVIGSKTNHDNVLMLDDLREKKLVRI